MLGYLSIFLALVTTGVSAVFYTKTFLNNSDHHKKNDSSNSEKKGTIFYKLATCMILLAAGWLYYVILNDNFRYEYVVSYSARNQALGYKISAFWAGQEGSLLLWALLHAFFGLILARKKAPVAMTTYCSIQILLLIILLVKSPFKALASVQPDGMGLNPLLQDPWMVIHPPILFLGYAALAIPFAWAVHGLITNRHKDTITQILPWTLFAWSSLGAGIFIGGFWAYKVLGWGGYWAWDPVENSSLVPWLITGTLLHMLLLARVNHAATKYVYLSAITNFVLVLYGTYLTRSGVLTKFSTHSFNDEGIGGLLILLVLITAISGLAILYWRWSRLPIGSLYPAIKSRECCLFIASILMATTGLMIFIGMSTPIITSFFGSPGNVSIKFYNTITLPLVTAMVLLLAWVPSLTWGNQTLKNLCWKHCLLLAITFTVMIFTFMFGIRSFFAVLTVGGSIAAIVTTGFAIRSKVLSVQAGLTHIGVFIALIGIMFSSLASQSTIISFEPEIRHEAFGKGITFLGKQTDVDGKSFYQKFQLENPIDTMICSRTKENETGGPSVQEPGIYHGLTADIYLAPLMKQQPYPELKVHKGEQISWDNLKIKFIRFSMNNSSNSEDIKVSALLEIDTDGMLQEIKPELISHNGQLIPAPLIAFNRYEISLISINIVEGLALISVHDLQPPPPETVEVEVSYKPLINFLWLGTIIIVTSTAWSAIKRKNKPYVFHKNERS